MKIKELISKLYEGDASGFESLFEEIMSEKMEEVIGAKYDDMFEAKECDDEEDDDDDEDDDLDEEFENLDELSQEKLRSYFARAATQREKDRNTVEKHMTRKSRPTPSSTKKSIDAYARYQRRTKGLKRATEKMD